MALTDELAAEVAQLLPERFRGRTGLRQAEGKGLRQLHGLRDHPMLIVENFKNIHATTPPPSHLFVC